ncbi:DCC1-like thiol-disulfide oxidoreductase family protein [Psychroflexus halocasei]|uniref:Predicted thiol-disulfide oxidoreductase YuxK, DCC family n=1 Tax=Psychroflexus halocasei TaxID=908615 RepID=A0A1H4D9U8_9FLAO|nr:DCC1-like thiol-disulfide oxidoreductase family protein [Psychroflexus halocasei]SEA69072.1 Predicted thiol-disulfide oxidoreductase YuxK, DCC family [Psychroflexus halocasei]
MGIFKSLKRAYLKKIDGIGLAIFRIVFSLVFLGEVLQLNYFQHLVFDKIPYVSPGEIAMWPIFFFWIIAIIFVIFGLFTRIATIVNYILTVIVLGTISSFEYHMFYTYLIVYFLFMFLPISRNLSLDRLRIKLKYSNTKFRYNPPTKVSVINYYLIIIFALGFVYFDSVFFKLTSDLWMNGLGLWFPASMPQANFFNISPLLNLKYLVIGLGYLTFVFEAIFLFVFWRKNWRLPVSIIGVGLHIGILICFPIPFFAIGVTGVYLLLIPVSFWRKLFVKKSTKKLVKFYYDAECPLCNRTRIILEHFDTHQNISFLTVQGNAAQENALESIGEETLLRDIHSVDQNGKVYQGVDTYIRVLKTIWYLKPLAWFIAFPGIYHIGKKTYNYVALNRNTERCTEETCGYEIPSLPPKESEMKILTNFTLQDLKIRTLYVGLVILCLLQLAVTYNSPLMINFRKSVGINDNSAVKATVYTAKIMHNSFSKPFFGITHHGVFMDSHFGGYNHSIAVLYKNNNKTVWLPIFDQDGTPGDYLFGSNWVKWTFRSNSPVINQKKLENSIRDFTAFWAKKNKISLENATFEIKVKKNRVPKQWEEDFLNKQLEQPWLDGGKVEWKNKEYYPNIKDIEKI